MRTKILRQRAGQNTSEKITRILKKLNGILLVTPLLFLSFDETKAQAVTGFGYTTYTSVNAGTLNYGTIVNPFTVTYSGTWNTKTFATYAPVSTPLSLSNYVQPTAMLELGAWITLNPAVPPFPTATYTFTSPLPATSVMFIQDVDALESFKIEFLDASGSVLNPSTLGTYNLSSPARSAATFTSTALTVTATDNINYGESLSDFVLNSGLVKQVRITQIASRDDLSASGTAEFYFAAPSTPTTDNESSLNNVAGSNVTLNLLTGDLLGNGSQATPALVTVNFTAPAGGTVSGNTITVPGQGVWTYVPATGMITFDPETGFGGNPTPVTYTITETATGLTSNISSETVTYTQNAPTTDSETSLNNPAGSNVTLDLLTGDLLSDGSQATPALVTVNFIAPAGGTVLGNTITVPGQGVWTYVPATGMITFDPEAGFGGNPTALTYTITQTATGLTSNISSETVTYTQNAPTTDSETSLNNPAGSNVTLDLLTGDLLSDGSQATPALVTVNFTAPAGGTVSGNTITVPGQGVWTYVPATGMITFDPETGFGGNPTALTYTITETSTGLTSNISSETVTYTQNAPTTDSETSLNNPAGSNVTLDLLTGDLLSDGSQATPALVTVNFTAPVGGTVTGNTITVPGEGVWTYVPATGMITFDPEAGFGGNPTVLTYTITETSTGLTSNISSETVTYTQNAPTTDSETSLNNTAGSNVTLDLLTGDLLSDGSQATPALVTVNFTAPAGGTVSGNTITVPGQGVWTYVPATGMITFDPATGFGGNPTPLTYTITEIATGLPSNVSSETITYTQNNPTTDSETSLNNTAGSNVTLDLLTGDLLSDGSQATPALVTVNFTAPAGGTVSGNTITVPGQGVWTYVPATGMITFDPETGFGGNPTPVTYTITETATGLTSNISSETVTYTQTAPTTDSETSLNNPAGSNVTLDLLTGDLLSDGSQATPALVTVNFIAPTGGTVSGNTITVPGQGVWTYVPATGMITFDPETGFGGNPTPVTYTITQTATGLTSNISSETVTYTQNAPTTDSETSLNNPAGSNVTLDLLTGDLLSDGTQATPALVTVNFIAPAGGTVSGNTITVPGQGVWTYVPATGMITFDPETGFGGNPTPVTYTITETATGLTSNISSETVTYSPNLPVDLVSFNGKQIDEQIMLAWKTANEVDFSHFEILKSTNNAKEFGSIGKIISSDQNSYSYADNEPTDGINYYKLRMVDLDGTSKLSKIISVRFDKNATFTSSRVKSANSQGATEINLYPNPASDAIFIKGVDYEAVKFVEVINTLGRVVHTSTSILDGGIDITPLSSGIYVAKITLTDGTVITQKVLVDK